MRRLNLWCAGIMSGLNVYPERMRENLEITQGLVFSQRVLLALIESGLSRQDAYAIVQRNSMQAWGEIRADNPRSSLAGQNRQETTAGVFRKLLDADTDVTSRLNAAALDDIFDYGVYTAHVDDSFRRLGLL